MLLAHLLILRLALIRHTSGRNPFPTRIYDVIHSIEKMDISLVPIPCLETGITDPSYRMALECGLSFCIHTR